MRLSCEKCWIGVSYCKNQYETHVGDPALHAKNYEKWLSEPSKQNVLLKPCRKCLLSSLGSILGCPDASRNVPGASQGAPGASERRPGASPKPLRSVSRASRERSETRPSAPRGPRSVSGTNRGPFWRPNRSVWHRFSYRFVRASEVAKAVLFDLFSNILL